MRFEKQQRFDDDDDVCPKIAPPPPMVPASIRAKGSVIVALDATYAPDEFVGTDGHDVEQDPQKWNIESGAITNPVINGATS